MKRIVSPLALLALCAAAALTGCVQGRRPLVLDTVGPAMANHSVVETNGSLVVFSAFDPTPHFSSLSYRIYYTDYRVLSEDGTLLQSVQNDTGTALEGPKTVSLPPGKYCIVARANGYGRVTVPVLIEARRTTTVHLEGSAASETGASAVHEELVRLPDGRIVGWRGGSEEHHAAASRPSAGPSFPHDAISGSQP
jgi:hypothetical protein